MKSQLLLFFTLTLIGCWDGTPKQPHLVWRSAPFGEVQIETFYPLFYEDKVIVSHNLKDGSFVICALRSADGSSVWEYRDTSEHSKHLYYNLGAYIFRHILVVPCGNRLVAIHLDNGRKIWEKTHHESAEDFLAGIGNTAYRTYCDPSRHRAYIYAINVEHGGERLVHTIEIPIGKKGHYRTPVPIFTEKGDTILVFTHIEQENQSRKTSACLSWMDTKGGVAQIDTIYPINFEGLGVTKQPMWDRDHGHLYLVANDEIVCLNIQARMPEWRKQMPRDMLTSRLLTDKKAVFFPAEDGNLYALNKLNGDLLWKAAISGTPSRIFDDGVCLHVVGGADGKWHIIHKKDGKVLFSISTPNTINYPNTFFHRAFALHPEKNEALLHDGKDFFCYKF
jgi:outer membrane protein assembly factor BamB